MKTKHVLRWFKSEIFLYKQVYVETPLIYSRDADVDLVLKNQKKVDGLVLGPNLGKENCFSEI